MYFLYRHRGGRLFHAFARAPRRASRMIGSSLAVALAALAVWLAGTERWQASAPPRATASLPTQRVVCECDCGCGRGEPLEWALDPRSVGAGALVGGLVVALAFGSCRARPRYGIASRPRFLEQPELAGLGHAARFGRLAG